MLRNLHIKNLALIREIDVDFAEGLNILTGETGAGKSIIIDSITMALGGKAQRSLVRDDAPYGLVELVFEINDPETLGLLEKIGVTPEEEGVIFISRKIQGNRSISRINGETRPAAEVRECASLLLDIHGQSEHQKLLRSEHQLELLDAFGGEKLQSLRDDVAEKYRKFAALRHKMGKEELSEEERLRRISFLEFEINEIEDANLRAGEDEELEKNYRKLANARKIVVAAGNAHELTGYDNAESAGETIGRAAGLLDSVSEYDEQIGELSSRLTEIEDLLNDFNRDLADYLGSLSFADEEFAECEERLNTVNHLKAKYGRTIDAVLDLLDAKKEELAGLMDYEEGRKRLVREYETAEKDLSGACDALSMTRKEAAIAFAKEVREQLLDLNFARADFDIAFHKSTYSEKGSDAVEYMIATNPGESPKPLGRVVSGGELSRIMLGIKTMFAKEDKTDTLIFDEVDTGISGRTAQKVAEKMAVISQGRQVICITHLPQIAAMADTHYGITKDVTDTAAITRIEALSDAESIDELARLIGGAEITLNTQNSAREMQEMCREYKDSLP
ncbi:MAG: DNA repair protein RecN [Lachnospiraceae bacterium]|nr:DNA repair protein RecN [Lachnospiraceae bacterium]